MHFERFGASCVWCFGTGFVQPTLCLKWSHQKTLLAFILHPWSVMVLNFTVFCPLLVNMVLGYHTAYVIADESYWSFHGKLNLVQLPFKTISFF
jgi:hypothetical protein